MKVPPKRKGNALVACIVVYASLTLNESPSEKEGKYGKGLSKRRLRWTLNESPSEKEGKSAKDNNLEVEVTSLNESPSEKEGK